MKCSAFIADGYTQPGYIKPLENCWPPVKFKFRPMLYPERKVILHDPDLPPDEQSALAAEAMSVRLVCWNVENPLTGKLVEINQQNVLRLQPDLFQIMFFIIAGQRASDTDPDWTDDQKETNTKERLAQAVAGMQPGPAREEADSKNSDAG